MYPRPAKRVIDKRTGRERLAPLRPREQWTDPRTGRTVKAGKHGSMWAYSITVTRGGQRRTVTKSGFARQKDAEAAAAKVLAALGAGDRRPLVEVDRNLTVGQWLDSWLESCRVRPDRPLKPTTHSGYANAIKVWIRPHIGDHRLVDLDRDHLVGLYRLLRVRGGRGRKKMGPAPRTPTAGR